MIKRFYIFILILLILFGCICSAQKEMQNDTFFTIATGNYLFENGIDDVEPLTFHENLKFTKLRWGFDLAISSIYSYFGFEGIYVFVLLFSCLLGVSIFYICYKISKLPTISASISMLIVMIFDSSLVARAQIVSYLIFAWEIYAIERLIMTSKKRYAFSLIVLSFLLLSFHSSVWILYPVLFLPYIAEFVIMKFLKSKNMKFIRSNDTNKKLFVITFISVLVSGFLTPLGTSPFTYPFVSMTTVAKEVIDELHFDINTYLVIVSVGSIILLLSFLKGIKISDLLYSVGMLVFAYIAYRNFIISFIVLGIIISKQFGEFVEFVPHNKIFKVLNNIVLSVFLIFVSCYVYSELSLFNEKKDIAFVPKEYYPVDAVNFVLKNMKINEIKMYTDLNWGSYVEMNRNKKFYRF